MKKNLLIVTVLVIFAFVGVTFYKTPMNRINPQHDSKSNVVLESETNNSSPIRSESESIRSVNKTSNKNMDSDLSEERSVK